MKNVTSHLGGYGKNVTKCHTEEEGGLNSGKKLSRIIWMAPNGSKWHKKGCYLWDKDLRVDVPLFWCSYGKQNNLAFTFLLSNWINVVAVVVFNPSVSASRSQTKKQQLRHPNTPRPTLREPEMHFVTDSFSEIYYWHLKLENGTILICFFNLVPAQYLQRLNSHLSFVPNVANSWIEPNHHNQFSPS